MPRTPTHIVLLLAAAWCAPGACLAQMRAQPDADGSAPIQGAAAVEGDMGGDVDMRTEKTRSAFGRVMAVMIAALQRQSAEQSRPAAPVRTTAAGTPMGIEVGAAFRDATAGHAQDDRPQDDPPLREAALAGPH